MLIATRDNFNKFVDILSQRHPGLLPDKLKDSPHRDLRITFHINIRSHRNEHRGVGEIAIHFPQDRLMHHFILKPLGIHSERLVGPILDDLRKEVHEILELVES